ncbi:MAG: hypothetical protein K0S58_1076 [Nitrospira sp.]|jgi:hypothetical protein|nr:hypothetical protein [Nitrospira sp.]
MEFEFKRPDHCERDSGIDDRFYGRGEETCNENWVRVKNLIADAMVDEVRTNRRAVGDRLVAVSEEEPCRA